MSIFAHPNKSRVLELLSACELPISDIEEHHMEAFLACGDEDNFSGVIGLETHGNYGLLRSLAVAPEARKLGCGKALVASIETMATSKGLDSIYLLTNTAEAFFVALGYIKVERSLVPNAIRNTTEFSSLCPDSATVMVKHF